MRHQIGEVLLPALVRNQAAHFFDWLVKSVSYVVSHVSMSMEENIDGTYAAARWL